MSFTAVRWSTIGFSSTITACLLVMVIATVGNALIIPLWVISCCFVICCSGIIFCWALQGSYGLNVSHYAKTEYRHCTATCLCLISNVHITSACYVIHCNRSLNTSKKQFKTKAYCIRNDRFFAYEEWNTMLWI